MSDLSMCVEDLKHVFGADRVMVIDENTDFSKLPNPFEKYEHLIDPETMKLDGYDDCIIGIVEGFNKDNVLCYDKDKIIDRLMEDGMDLDDAHDYFGFNILGAYVGSSTPCFLIK